MKKVETNNKLKEISIKNRTCYHSDGIIKFEDFDIDKYFQTKIFSLYHFITFISLCNFDWCKIIAC